MKKKIIIIISAVLLVSIVAAGAVIALNSSSVTVDVMPASLLDESYWTGSDQEMYGEITTDATQEIYLADGQKVKEVYVEEGQKVDVGDDLLSYDNSIKNLELEIEKLQLEIIGLEVKSANIELEKLKKEKPYTPPPEPTEPEEEIQEQEPEELPSEPDPEPENNNVEVNQQTPVMSPEEDLADETEGRTKEDINNDIDEQKQLIREKELEKKESELKISSLESELEKQATLKSTVKGEVKKVGDPEEGKAADGTPFIVVASEEGLYLKGAVNELQLEQFQPGLALHGESFESMSSFEAEVKEVSPYPSKSEDYSWGNNPNSSEYAFTAYIENGEGLKNNEWVSIYIQSEEQGKYLCLQDMYVRQEEGKHFVFIADENGKLKKQYVTVGKKLYGTIYEIIEGVDREDYIAFPYGKQVKEGIKVKYQDEEEVFE